MWLRNCDPICLLCGAIFPDPSSSSQDDSPVRHLRHDFKEVLEPAEWKKYYSDNCSTRGPRRANVFVLSAKLENAVFPSRELASRYFRAAVRSPSRTKYQLTGIDVMPNLYDYHWVPLRVPTDMNTARIDGDTTPRLIKKIFTIFRPAELDKESRALKGEKVGYLFHMSCWSILGHFLGREVIQENPGKIVRAAEQYWKDHRLQDWGLRGKIIYPGWHSKCTCYGESWDMHGPGCPKGIIGYDIYKNPWIIPKVQNAIEVARELHFGQHRSHGPSNFLNQLPPEILLCIADILCPANTYSEHDLQDIRNMLIAFSLCLPVHFWNVRFKFHHMRHLFFELDTLKDDGILDNQFLMLNLMHLVLDNDFFRRQGLANRERVLRRIMGIIGVYSRNEEASGTRSVNGPMNELASV